MSPLSGPDHTRANSVVEKKTLARKQVGRKFEGFRLVQVALDQNVFPKICWLDTNLIPTTKHFCYSESNNKCSL